MRELKKEKIREIIERLAARFVLEESTSASLITITRVEISPTGRDGKVFFTTLPEDKEETAEKFLNRKIPEFKKKLRKNSRIGILPHLSFKIDKGERNRQRLDELDLES